MAVIYDDLQKALVSLHVGQCAAISKALGAPGNVCRLAMNIFCELARIFTYKGVYDREWIVATHGLLQGCPLFMILIAGPLAAWEGRVALTGSAATTLVDDRH
eukprot:7332092-Alexandrium_andersonii.AAC.1